MVRNLIVQIIYHQVFLAVAVAAYRSASRDSFFVHYAGVGNSAGEEVSQDVDKVKTN